MRISQLAEHCGVPATTLRFYEGAGLLQAGRTASVYRNVRRGGGGPPRVHQRGQASRSAALRDRRTPRREGGRGLRGREGRPAPPDRRPPGRSPKAGRELTSFTASLHTALEHLDALLDRTSQCDPECGFLTPPAPTGASRAVDVVLSPSNPVRSTTAASGSTRPRRHCAGPTSGFRPGTTAAASGARPRSRVRRGRVRVPVLPTPQAPTVPGVGRRRPSPLRRFRACGPGRHGIPCRQAPRTPMCSGASGRRSLRPVPVVPVP